MQSDFHLSTTIQDSQWNELFVLQYNCFRNSPQINALQPRGLDPLYRETYIQGFKNGVFGGPVERVSAILSDPKSGEIVSYISCRVWRGALGILEGGNEGRVWKLPGIEDLKEREFREWVWGSFDKDMRECKEMQVPHIYVQSLATDPKWQGKGAASRLLGWVFEFGVKEKLGRCMLQCSNENKGFYERFGFRAVDERTFAEEKLFPGRVGPTILKMVRDS